MGSTEGHWRQVADERVEMVHRPEDRLVAVAGLGLSQDETKAAAQRLREAGLPMIADIVTATEIDKVAVNGLARVNPTIEDEMKAIRRYVNEKSRRSRAMMVSYSKENDLYAKSLVAAMGGYLAEQWTRGGRIAGRSWPTTRCSPRPTRSAAPPPPEGFPSPPRCATRCI